MSLGDAIISPSRFISSLNHQRVLMRASPVWISRYGGALHRIAEWLAGIHLVALVVITMVYCI